MHGVLVNRLGGLSLPRKSVVRLTDRPDMTLDVYRGRKTTMQQKDSFKMIEKSNREVRQYSTNSVCHLKAHVDTHVKPVSQKQCIINRNK